MTPTQLTTLRLIESGLGDLPLPGAGSTSRRLAGLFDIAREHPVGVARLIEAHTDAVAILAEANSVAEPDRAYGVWASERPQDQVVFDPTNGSISGTKAFCSGVGIVDRALVTVSTASGTHLLVDVSVAIDADSITAADDDWATTALSDVATRSVRFDRHPVNEVLGGDGWYLTRPGFWHGACAPAACWAGAAAGLTDAAQELAGRDDIHRQDALGALLAATWSLEAMLRVAGDEIDANPDDAQGSEQRARSLRFLVERTCTDMADRFSRAFGPRPFVGNAAIAQRAHDLHLYLRQHHGERELAAIAAAADRDDVRMP